MKKNIAMVVITGLLLGFSAPVFAGSSNNFAKNDRDCQMKEGQKGHWGAKQYFGNKMGHCPVMDKVALKSKFILENKAALALTDDQAKAIKDLETQAEKMGIQQKASMETFRDDLKSKLREEKIDTAGIHAIIDTHFSAMAVSMKANVDAYAKLKGILTPEQSAKMKAIWKDKEGNKKDHKRK